MPNAYISKQTVDEAKPGARDLFIWDAHDKREVVKGFGLKVTPSGSKVYVYQYRLAKPGQAAKTAMQRYTIGKHGALTPDQARTEAKRLAAIVARSGDPKKEERDAIAAQEALAAEAAKKARLEGDLRFEKVAERFLDWYENDKGRRPSSVALARLVIERYLVPTLSGTPMPHIGREQIAPILDSIPAAKRGIRRAVYAYSSILWGWAIRRGYVSANPLKAMEKPQAPNARNRVLSDAELADIWRASTTLPLPFGAFFRLLLLTGQRRSEVAGAKWTEFDRATGTWTIPAARAKNGQAHLVPLSDMVLAELDALALAEQTKAEEPEPDAKRWPKSGPVLSTRKGVSIGGITKIKTALDTAITKARDGEAIDAWRIHDLRRTLATGFQRLGIRFEVTEATLNHISGARSGIAGIYQHHDWKVEKRSALTAWAKHVAVLLKPARKTNVVAIDAAKKSA